MGLDASVQVVEIRERCAPASTSSLVLRLPQAKRDRLKLLYKEIGKLFGKGDSDFLVIGYTKQTNRIIGFERAIKDHTLNLENSPELGAAYEFDQALMRFSESFTRREISSCYFAPLIDSEMALGLVVQAIKTEVIEKLCLHEYFLINIAEHVQKLQEQLRS